MLSMQNILIIGFVIALLFGVKNLPGIGKGVGEGIRNFKKGLDGDSDDVEDITPKKITKTDEVSTETEKKPEEKEV